MRQLIHTIAAVAIMALSSAPAWSQEDVSSGTICPDSKILSGKLVTDVCWSCMFPIRVAGVSFGGGDAPSAAAGGATCSCDDALGVMHPGWVQSMWEPARLVELVRFPGCSPIIGGARLPVDQRALGTAGLTNKTGQDKAFYHYHYFAFPLLVMLDMFTEPRCNAGGHMDMDLMYLSELDPTWNNDELAFFTNPEAAAIANPIAITSCAADAAAATAGSPIDSMWWCAGSWGTMYPLSGSDTAAGMVQNTSMLATKAVAALHRRGLAWRTMGSDVMCRPKIEVMFPKSQYKWSMMFPVAESNDSHVTGESVMKWGLGRTIPGFGEDAVYMLWRWTDCCMTF